MPPSPLVLNTDRRWYDFLSSLGAGTSPARLDEANFWSPRAVDTFGRQHHVPAA